jgi:hypothetical protein
VSVLTEFWCSLMKTDSRACGFSMMCQLHTTDHSVTALDAPFGDCDILWLLSSKFAVLCACAVYF